MGQLLHYHVTQPKPDGPTEAEKKIEAMMAEIENEMENGLPGAEFFGICHQCSERVKVTV